MSRDLFDDSTMSFGEHLEVLRYHLIKALLGLVVGIIVALFFSNHVIDVMLVPVQNSLQKYYSKPDPANADEDENSAEGSSTWDSLTSLFGGSSSKPALPAEKEPPGTTPVAAEDESAPGAGSGGKTVVAQLDVLELLKALHAANPQIPGPPENAKPTYVAVRVPGESVQPAAELPRAFTSPTTLAPEEAFMIYIKVAVVTGLVISSPWVFYQLWLFVAAGLYPHERRYVYTYLPMSLGLFLGGAALCFFAVIPMVLDFLFSFNAWLNLMPQIRITEWISFAVLLPVMFGVSFQLPLVMLFLERISIFDADDYREKRRMSILVISIISMILTPSDPMSMMMMMIPLLILYELGILLCGSGSVKKSPFDDDDGEPVGSAPLATSHR